MKFSKALDIFKKLSGAYAYGMLGWLQSLLRIIHVQLWQCNYKVEVGDA